MFCFFLLTPFFLYKRENITVTVISLSFVYMLVSYCFYVFVCSLTHQRTKQHKYTLSLPSSRQDGEDDQEKGKTRRSRESQFNRKENEGKLVTTISEFKKQVMQNAIDYHSLTNAQSAPEGESPIPPNPKANFTCCTVQHNSIWYGISL